MLRWMARVEEFTSVELAREFPAVEVYRVLGMAVDSGWIRQVDGGRYGYSFLGVQIVRQAIETRYGKDRTYAENSEREISAQVRCLSSHLARETYRKLHARPSTINELAASGASLEALRVALRDLKNARLIYPIRRGLRARWDSAGQIMPGLNAYLVGLERKEKPALPKNPIPRSTITGGWF
jgi:hypothetical protein